MPVPRFFVTQYTLSHVPCWLLSSVPYKPSHIIYTECMMMEVTQICLTNKEPPKLKLWFWIVNQLNESLLVLTLGIWCGNEWVLHANSRRTDSDAENAVRRPSMISSSIMIPSPSAFSAAATVPPVLWSLFPFLLGVVRQVIHIFHYRNTMNHDFSCCSLDGLQKGVNMKVCVRHRYHKMACSMVYSKSLLMNVYKTWFIVTYAPLSIIH